MIQNKKLLLVFLFCLCSLNAVNGDLYVSVNGSDSNPGTEEKPFRTISRAQERVRQSNSDMSEDIIVNLREGDYYLDEMLIFDQRDSGTNGHSVIYKAYEDEQVTISGGKVITGWQKNDEGLLVADSEGLLFRQLYVNDQKATRARTPNKGNFFQLTAWDFDNEKIFVRYNLIHQYEDFKDAEMVVQMTWAESVLRIKKKEDHGLNWTKESHFYFKDEDSKLIFNRAYPQAQAGQYFHFENSKEFIDQPGEWYLDTEKEKIFLKPSPGQNENNIEIVAPVLETILKVEGTLDEPVKNIKFEGLTFKHGNWTRPSLHGNMNTQAGQYHTFDKTGSFRIWNHPPAGIFVGAAENIVFEKNVITFMGSTGIDLYYGTRNCKVNGNLVTDISGNGISIAKFFYDEQEEEFIPYDPEDKRDVCTSDTISNNVVKNIGTDYFGSCAIAAGYPAEVKIVHNHISDVPYTGISLGFGWSQAPNAMHDNYVAYNDISDAAKIMVDGAGIYTLSMQPGTVIEYNKIYNIDRTRWSVRPAPVAGIYCDQGSSGTEENPFIIRKNHVAYGIHEFFMMHRVGQIVFDNNIHNVSHEGGEYIERNVGPEPEYRYLLKK